MADERSPNPRDEQRVRWGFAAVLLALLGVGVVVNLYTGQERFNSIFLTAFLIAMCGLLGKQIKLR